MFDPLRGATPLSRVGSRSVLMVGALVFLLLVAWSLPAQGTGSFSREIPTSSAGFPLVAAPSERTGPSRGVDPAIAGPGWVNVTDSVGAPPKVSEGSAAMDPLDNETVYFGGCIAGGACPSNQTWVFSGGRWADDTNPHSAPPAREYASMDFDANAGGVIMFGGKGASGLLNDTWLFHAGVWTNVGYLGFGPSPREGASLVFDPAPEEEGSVLFGGCVPEFILLACTNDTWVWQMGSGWVPIRTSIAPPEGGFAAFAYDPADGYALLFGGLVGSFSVLNSTWEFYSGQWWAANPPLAPPGVADASAVYDPGLSGVLLFGGLNASLGYSSATWLFSDGTWAALSTPSALAPRSASEVALDGSGTTPVLTGGENATETFGDTWAYEMAPSLGASENLSNAEVGESVHFTFQVNGGTAPYQLAVQLGDSSVEQFSGTGAIFTFDHSFDHVGSFNVSTNLTDGVGAQTSGNTLTLTISAGPQVRAYATASSGDVGIPLSFSETVLASGTLPLTYAWQFGDGTNGSEANLSHAFAMPGSYQVYLNATDGVGATSSSSVLVEIAPALAAAITTLPGPTAGTPEGFGAGATGGTAPFTYAWRFGDGNSSSGASPQHVYAQAGTYSVEVWVNDSVGASAHATTSLVVGIASGSSSSGSSSPVPVWFWAGLAGLAVVVVAGVFFLARRRP
ncbi:MAG TPA: PKD domain-containing protein [Thermoplasmata archaeon]|nr:PKD domain-containing protein [Thermoplasmata archaeon]